MYIHNNIINMHIDITTFLNVEDIPRILNFTREYQFYKSKIIILIQCALSSYFIKN